MEKLSASEIKLQNRQMVYRYIRENGPVSKQDIVVALQLSLPTVTQNLEYLKKQGLIDASRKIKHTGGRNATAYTYIKNAKTAIGVSLTANHMSVVAVDLSGEVIGLVREKAVFDLGDETYLKKLGETVELVKETAGISTERLLGVGISVPGFISDDGEEVTYGRTLGFTGRKREEIARYIPYRHFLVHDSYAAGCMESWENHRITNAFYISLGNSIGGTVIIQNEIYQGDSRKGGEIGHMTVVPSGGKTCYCGKKGCFDTVCRATNLDTYTDGNLEEFFLRLKQGDKKAEKMWKEYLNHLSLAIHNIRMLFDGSIILGGYVGAYIGDYMELLCQKVDARNPFGDKAEQYLLECRYKVEAVAAGAAIFYVDRFLKSI
ncbi:ROK family transcriptional regulator [Suipraeoptans intestinalis]|uniref:ROK family transcriptional regulator n=1 Tax=Suipraeoptans intestinalis TaxID=2606628 RepID=UPI001F17B88F|nr:ROK family transcriptional regulator [Suipraeoptans intestinalis]MDD7770269.1 ROK family transcriptional regulator [Suipraeoptans intestinalis]MDY3121118.1 ROK family transcriptional regulator [Suipraeoptans intestinalis]